MLYKRRKVKTKIDLEYVKETLNKCQFEFKRIFPADNSYTNDVFEIEQEEKKFIIKFFTDQWEDKKSGEREMKIISLLKKKDIPTPKVILFRKQGKRNFMIMEKLEGVPLYKELKKMSSKEINKILEILKKFSEIKGKQGFVYHDKKIHKTYKSHFDFINDSVFYGLKKLEDLGFETGFLKEQLLEFKEKISERKDYSFTHCDFTPKHILLKEGQIKGILDFEWAIFSEPINDAVLFLISLSEYTKKTSLLKPVLEYCKSLAPESIMAYYASRIYIFKAAWPHKQVIQPEYSQDCLDKARKILENKKIELEDLLWKKNPGEIWKKY